MSNLAEIKRIEEAFAAQVADFQRQLNALKASALTVTISAASLPLAEGERYAGAILKDDGSVDYHVILLPGDVDMTWEAAGAWAKEQGGQLPTRREQSLLIANLKAEFKGAWHWSGEQHPTNSDDAYVQHFGNGDQDWTHKSSEYRARAVRRISA